MTRIPSIFLNICQSQERLIARKLFGGKDGEKVRETVGSYESHLPRALLSDSDSSKTPLSDVKVYFRYFLSK